MAKKTTPTDERPNTENDGNSTSKMAANKTEKELNPHHQNAKPKGKK